MDIKTPSLNRASRPVSASEMLIDKVQATAKTAEKRIVVLESILREQRARNEIAVEMLEKSMKCSHEKVVKIIEEKLWEFQNKANELIK